jgi:hypothetical protein
VQIKEIAKHPEAESQRGPINHLFWSRKTSDRIRRGALPSVSSPDLKTLAAQIDAKLKSANAFFLREVERLVCGIS